MEIRKVLFCMLLIFNFSSFYAQSRFKQTLHWQPDKNAFEYTVEIVSADVKDKKYDFTTGKSEITFSLPSGKYRYRIHVLDMLGREAQVSEWNDFEIIKAVEPKIRLKNNKPDVIVVSPKEIVIPVDADKITEDAEVTLVNVKNGKKLTGKMAKAKDVDDTRTIPETGTVAIFPAVHDGVWKLRITNPGGLSAETETVDVSSILEQKRIEEKRLAEEAKAAEETARKAEEKRLAEEAKAAEETARKAEEKRLAEEAKAAEEAARKAEEKRLAEEAKAAEETARKAEEKRLAEEAKAAEETAKKAEEKRLAEEAKAAEETAKKAEEKRLAKEAKTAEKAAKKVAAKEKLAKAKKTRAPHEFIIESGAGIHFSVYDSSIIETIDEKVLPYLYVATNFYAPSSKKIRFGMELKGEFTESSFSGADAECKTDLFFVHLNMAFKKKTKKIATVFYFGPEALIANQNISFSNSYRESPGINTYGYLGGQVGFKLEFTPVKHLGINIGSEYSHIVTPSGGTGFVSPSVGLELKL